MNQKLVKFLTVFAILGFCGCQSIHVGGSGEIGGISGGGGMNIPVPSKK